MKAIPGPFGRLSFFSVPVQPVQVAQIFQKPIFFYIFSIFGKVFLRNLNELPINSIPSRKTVVIARRKAVFCYFLEKICIFIEKSLTLGIFCADFINTLMKQDFSGIDKTA